MPLLWCQFPLLGIDLRSVGHRAGSLAEFLCFQMLYFFPPFPPVDSDTLASFPIPNREVIFTPYSLSENSVTFGTGEKGSKQAS